MTKPMKAHLRISLVLTALLLGQTLLDAGLPPKALNIIVGEGGIPLAEFLSRPATDWLE